MKKFDVDSFALLLLYIILIPSVLIALTFGFMLLSRAGFGSKFLGALWISGGTLAAFYYLRMPYTIIVKQWNVVIFKSLFSERETFMPDIVSIHRNADSFLIHFKLSDRDIAMVNRIEDLHLLIIEIRKNHCNLITKGC